MQMTRLRKQSFQSFLLGLGVVLCAAASPVARAACDCGSTDPAAPCTGTTVGRTVGGATLQLTVSCNGRACQCGQFPLGESWVVPIDDQGVNSTTVRVSAMHADVSAAVANPTTSGGGQGLIYAANEPDGTALDAAAQLKGWGYKATLDVRTQLPYSAPAGTSILSAKTQRHGACPGWIGGICMIASDVVTVLGTVPPGAGSTVLRPPFAGTTKPLYSTTQLALGKIPRYTLTPPTRPGHRPPSFARTATRWSQPQYELCRYASPGGLCPRGTFRAMVPISAFGTNYGASLAASYYESLVTVMDDAAMTGDKRSAVYALFQHGMDLYWQMKAGAAWGTNGGHNVGRKAPIAFFAALAKDGTILSEVQQLSVEQPERFQENAQIASTSCAGDVLWGEDNQSEDWYWYQLLTAQCFNGATGTCAPGGFRGNRYLGDPHDYIDGPSGLPGAAHMAANAVGTFVGQTLTMYMMPELRRAANDERLIRFVEKHFVELGENTEPGHFRSVKAIVRPDPCAPPTERDARAGCTTLGGVPACLDYKKLWGPDPKRPGECIYHNGDVATDGRFGHLSDTETRHGVGRVRPFTGALWTNSTFREAVAACEHTAQKGLCPTAP